MSSLYESNNNNTEPNSDEFWYDKNEFYSENGLSKGQKKNRKSHGKKAQEQQQQREDKVAKQVLLLPKKMQKALKALDSNKTDRKEKEKEMDSQVKYIKTLNRKGKKEDFAFTLAEQEQDEVVDDSDEVVDDSDEVVDDSDEVVDDSDEVVEQYDLSARTYIHAKREFQMYPDNWSKEDLEKFQKTIERYEALSDYEQGVKLWQMYGLTEAQYIEHLEQLAEMRVQVLNEDTYDSLTYDVQETDDVVAEELDDVVAEEIDDEAWWYCSEQEEEEDEEEKAAAFADWLEAKEEERMEFAIQNCIDDMYMYSD
jgi:hypothetical protein